MRVLVVLVVLGLGLGLVEAGEEILRSRDKSIVISARDDVVVPSSFVERPPRASTLFFVGKYTIESDFRVRPP